MNEKNNIKNVGLKCFGCTACLAICPKKAITMKYDKKGFLYPNIDEKKCVNCGLCLKTCPAINNCNEKKDLSKEKN